MWKPQIDSKKPLYLAIADALERDAAEKILKPGQKLPPQRDLADALKVNLSTISRSFKECERRGLISGTVGRGTFISVDSGVSVPLVQPDTPQTGLIEMGLVLPFYHLESEIAAQIKKVFKSLDPAPLLRYTDPMGLPEHREAGAIWSKRLGMEARMDEVLVASGAQNALACCLTGLFRSGDRLAVDALTYPGLKTLAGLLGLRLVPIPLDDSGILPDALEKACRRDPVKGLYLMPEFQNPTTCRLSGDRRKMVLQIIERHGLILLEDDAYGYTSESRPTPLSAELPMNGIFICGLSKAFGAGLRVSFIRAAPKFQESLKQAILTINWMTSPLTAEMATRIIHSGLADKAMAAKRIEAETRCKTALKRLSSFSIKCRPQGFFIWLELPDYWTGREFELTARQAGVRIFCAEKFAVGGGKAPAAVRVSLSGVETRDKLDKGLDILAGILAGGYRNEEPIF